MRVTASIVAALLLAGCAHQSPAPLPPVTVLGPKFAATDFEAGQRPIEPDPATVGLRGGSAAARFENRLGAWGDACRVKLESVGRRLSAAGLVTGGQ